ncbi:MAG: prephenate dehydrogenase [Vicinamibacterales bacterium]
MSKSLPVVQPGSPGHSPVFEKIAIVGLGLMGGSLALAAREVWPSALVIGVDEKDVLERAMVQHAIDVAADDLVVISEADLVVLAAPVEENISLLGRLDEFVPGQAVVTDLGSTKRAIVAAGRSLPKRFTFVGGHPLAGAARGGIEFARPDLFKGRPWIFTPDRDSTAQTIDRLFAFVSGVGAHPRAMDAEVHDRLLAFLSHLPQLTASALMRIVGEEAGDDGLSLAGRGLGDTTRLASSPARIWREVCATNADHIGDALDQLIKDLQTLRGDLTKGDAIERIFEAAAAWKARMPS